MGWIFFGSRLSTHFKGFHDDEKQLDRVKKTPGKACDYVVSAWLGSLAFLQHVYLQITRRNLL